VGASFMRNSARDGDDRGSYMVEVEAGQDTHPECPCTDYDLSVQGSNGISDGQSGGPEAVRAATTRALLSCR